MSSAHVENRARTLIAGRYRILEELGRGGMGAVYRARDRASGHTLALKTCERADARLTSLFEREYHTLASLRHPRVIEVFDFGITAEGQRFYTMELLSGDDLHTLSPLPYVQACAHLRDVATSLALLHARKLLHRDVSPRNVRLDSRGRAKLLDFGALGDFGLAREIVGTPPCMAPEAIRRLPLDQRSDLFSLGATLYFALTGGAPFAIRHLSEAEAAHRTPPPAPSTLVPGIPSALDDLVLSLLRPDPMERPSSAAEVIDRLNAIAGGLDSELVAEVAESHLLSSALIGREREKGQLLQHLGHALRGAGGVVVIDGASGMGRTRLANELCLDARIAGATTLRVDALAHPEPGGTLRALCQALLEVAPVEAMAALPRHVGVLGQALEELRERVRPAGPAVRLPKEPAERRASVQNAFLAWLTEVSERRPLLLVVDDAHTVDTDSAGALVLIAHAAPRLRLLLAVTQEREANAPVAIQQLARVAARIRLRSLPHADVDRLIASVFGDVPHRARLGQWLSAAGRGNPGQSLELLRHLVSRGLIRYAGGAWTLPSELPEHELPKGLDDALLARLDALGPNLLRLVRLFALHRGALPLSACFELAPEQSDVQTVSALDQLVAQEILVRSGHAYRFGQEASRARLLEALPAGELAALHAALGQAFLRTRPELFRPIAQRAPEQLSTADLGLALRVAAHLERGGDQARGREIMREAAVELTVRGDGLAEAVPALEAAIAAHREQGRVGYELAPLLVPLTLAGTYSDFRLTYRYGEETLDLLLELSGLSWSRRLSRVLGGRLALVLGLLLGFLRFHLRARSIITITFREVMLGIVGIGTALLGTYSVVLDKERAKSVAARLEVLRFFPAGHTVRWVHLLQEALLDTTLGDAASACKKAMRVLEALQDEGSLPGLREEARLQLQVGCLTPVSLAYGLRLDDKLNRVLAALDRLHISVSRQIAAGSRAAFHGHRGERAKFIAHHEEMDALASRAGSTWREDVGTPRQMWSTYALCEDVIGLKRAAHDLGALAAELPSLRQLRDASRACYLSERGMHEQALLEFGAMFEQAVLEGELQGVRFAGAYARILRMAGRSARAKEVCELALSRLSPDNHEFELAVFGAKLELVLAEAALGQLDAASARLDAWIGSQGYHDNPLVHGLLHKARAQIALAQRDAATCTHHLNQMESWFRRSANPALIAQCQRLAKEARGEGAVEPERLAAPDCEGLTWQDSEQVSVAFHLCRGPAERLQVALELVLSRTGAEHGYLYLLEPAGLRFAAPLVGSEPPEGLLHQLAARIERLREDPLRTRPEGAFETTVYDEEPLAGGRAATSYSSLLLSFPREHELVVVGAIALLPGALPIAPVDPSFLESVARAIYSAGDVRSVYFDATDGLATVRERPAPANHNG